MDNRVAKHLKSAALPALALLAIGLVHLFWSKWFPAHDPAQARWAALPSAAEGPDWLAVYLETGEYWLGYAYALSGAFAVAALQNLFATRRRQRAGAAEGGLAAGSFTFAGGLALGGCFLIGCCGSPMLAVWLSLFGASFLPFAKPLVAALTTTMIVAAWLWMLRRRRRCAADESGCC